MSEHDIELRWPGTDGLVTATIATVGGGIRSFTHGGHDVIPLDAPGSHVRWFTGVVMAPWSNRLRDGHWQLDGVDYQLPLNDSLGHALHGLVFDRAFHIVSRLDHAVVLECDIDAVPGYPFPTSLHVAYALDDRGLTSTLTITNHADRRIPVSVGAHPYFACEREDEVVIGADALCAIDARKIPTGALIAPTAKGIRPHEATPLRDLDLDDTVTALARDDDGNAHVLLRSARGVEVDIWQGPGFDYTVVFTCPEPIWADSPARAIAIEPQTGPTDALNSGTDAVWLEPAESRSFTWGVAVRRSGE